MKPEKYIENWEVVNFPPKPDWGQLQNDLRDSSQERFADFLQGSTEGVWRFIVRRATEARQLAVSVNAATQALTAGFANPEANGNEENSFKSALDNIDALLFQTEEPLPQNLRDQMNAILEQNNFNIRI